MKKPDKHIQDALDHQVVKAKAKKGTKFQKMVYSRLIANDANARLAEPTCYVFSVLFAILGILSKVNLLPYMQDEIIGGACIFFLTLGLFLGWTNNE